MDTTPAAAFRLDHASVWRRGLAGERHRLLQDVVWEAGVGEQWALLGPNGAGKTTLLTLLAAVKHSSEGTVEVLGRRMGHTNVFRLRQEVGFVDARLGRRFARQATVVQVVATGAANTIALRSEPLSGERLDRLHDLLDAMGIGRLAARRFADCSHGERTRALIARALVPSPRLLLLDEPCAGLDFEGRETLLAALGRLADRHSTLTTVTTTHHVEELAPSTTHALLLCEGHVVAQGPTAQTLTDTVLSRCFGLPIRIARTNGRWSATG